MSVFGVWDYSALALYLLAVVAVGFYCGRGQHNIKDFLVAGGSARLIPLSLSMFASLFSSVSYLGMPAEAYRNDVQYFVGYAMFFPAAFISCYLFIEFYRRLNIYTVFEYVEKRYNAPIRTLAVILFIVYRALYVGLVVYAISLAVHVTTRFPLHMVIIFIGVSAVLYTSVGGLKAVIWTDVMQFFVLGGSIIIILCFLCKNIDGGLSELISVGNEHQKFKLANFSFSLTLRITFWGAMLGHFATFMAQKGADQVTAQLYIAGRSTKEAKRALMLGPFFSVTMMTLLVLCGIGFFVYYTQHPNAQVAEYIANNQHDKILPFFVVNVMPRGIRGLIIAGLIAAAMSTVDSVLTSMSTSTLIDVYKRWLKPQASDSHYLVASRIFMVFWGIVIICLALFIIPLFSSIVKAANSVIGPLAGVILGIILLGMFSRRTNAAGVFVGILAGLGVVVYIFFCTKVMFMLYAVFGLASTTVVGYVASLFFARPKPEKIEGLMWKQVVLEALRREKT